MIAKRKGESVMDTIELLEAIGSDAVLRYASAEDLASLLEGVKASTALLSAAATADRSTLTMEFGDKVYYATESTQTPGHEEEEEDEEPEPGDEASSLLP